MADDVDTKSEHGTNARYSRGCRCPQCMTAHAEYAREYRSGNTRTVDAEPLREWLNAQWDLTSMSEISRRTGVHGATLRAIRAGAVKRTNREILAAVEPLMNA